MATTSAASASKAKIGWKSAGIDDAAIDGDLIDDIDVVVDDVDGDVSVLSAMVNGLLDFGDDDGWNGYVGGGIGVASVKIDFDTDTALATTSDSDSGFAWQAIAGVRKAISENIDLGLKYRFFNAGGIKYRQFGQRWRAVRASTALTRCWRA